MAEVRVFDGNQWHTVLTSGPTGPTGPVGPVGPSGGPVGRTGPTGPSGGPEGPTGGLGITGPLGPTGPIGITGPQGRAGVPGSIGPRGLIGLPGPIGPIGGLGKTGPTGPKGTTGDYGPTGDSGSSRSLFFGSAGETLIEFDKVYLSPSNNKWYKAIASGASTVDVYGIVTSPNGILVGQEGEISAPGVINNLTGLSAGSVYYLSPTIPGDWTTTQPETGQWQVPLGIATSSTDFLFQPGFISFLQSEELEWVDIGVAGEALNYGDVVYQDTSTPGYYKKSSSGGNVRQARADGLVMDNSVLIEGQVRVRMLGKFINSAHWDFYPGSVVYLSLTAGQVSMNQSLHGYNTIIGRALTSDMIWFNPGYPVLIT